MYDCNMNVVNIVRVPTMRWSKHLDGAIKDNMMLPNICDCVLLRGELSRISKIEEQLIFLGPLGVHRRVVIVILLEQCCDSALPQSHEFLLRSFTNVSRFSRDMRHCPTVHHQN